MSVPNQKIVAIDRTLPPDKKYIKVDQEIFFSAAKRLTKSGIICYSYFLSQIPNSWSHNKNAKDTKKNLHEISSSAIANKTGISTDAANDGINNLISQGYLKLIKGNFYQFIDILPQDKIMSPEEYEEKTNYEKIIEMGLNMIEEERHDELKRQAISSNSNTKINFELLKSKYPMYDWENKDEYLERIKKSL